MLFVKDSRGDHWIVGDFRNKIPSGAGRLNSAKALLGEPKSIDDDLLKEFPIAGQVPLYEDIRNLLKSKGWR